MKSNSSYRLIFTFFSWLIIAWLLSGMGAQACTTFCIDTENTLVIGRNYDWDFDEGMIMVNKRGHEKTAFIYWGESSSGLARWTSKYGSITFNQYGRDIAFSGMNEAGMVVSELWLDESVYPSADDRLSMSVDQYVQYILDNFSSVDEIIESDAQVRVRPTTDDFTKIHFMATDSTGETVVIEFLGGQMVYHTGTELPVKVMTNHTYDASIAYYNNGVPPSPSNDGSLARFYQAAEMIADFNPHASDLGADHAFLILEQVAQGNWTKFRTVFDIQNRRIYYTSLQAPSVRYFDLSSFDFSCETISMVLDLNMDHEGAVDDNFIDYTTELNENMITIAWNDLGYTDIYQPALELVSEYPETFGCQPDALENAGTDRQNVKVYPNPSEGILFIDIDGLPDEALNMMIWDLQGNRFYPGKETCNGSVIDLTGLARGIYLIELSFADGKVRRRVHIR